MRVRYGFAVVVVGLCLALAGPRAARALPPETLESVVSVLPIWPGRAQGGTGGPPGTAPEGSGIVLAPDVIATAWHVIEPASRIDVRLSDGRILPATPIAHDAASDIALLRVNADLVPIVPSGPVALAQPVCAVGNAFGLGLSVTCGVVSATSVSDAGFNPIEDFVQTDAAANPGSSGGALVDAEGRLVGMVSAIFASGADTNIGVNFAVSTALLTRVAEALLSRGEVVYPDPGWRLETADRQTLARVTAPRVAAVVPDGSADRAGILPGDLVLRIGARSPRTPRDAVTALALLAEGAATVDVELLRGDQRISRALELALPSSRPPADADQVLGDCPHPAPVCAMRQAVFPVSAFDPLASATRIGPDLLVTNRHVLGDRADAVVYTPDGPRGAVVVPSAYPGDLVLLRVEGLPEAGLIPPLAEGAMTPEAPYFAIGADVARQEVRVFAPGDLLAPPAPGAPLGRLHVGAVMQPGVSGGALVDDEGALVGIAVGGGEGRYEAIPVAQVLQALDARSHADAAVVSERLGTAYAACARLIETVVQTPAEAGALEADCARADNPGQLLEAGRVLARAGDIDGAIALHEQAVAQVPNSANARLSLLVSLQLGARFEDMLPHARWMLNNAPDAPQAPRLAIQSGVWGGDADLARAGLEQLGARDPAQAEAARRFIEAAPPRPARR